MYLLYNYWAVVTASVAALLHPDRDPFHCPEKFFHDSVTHPILKRNFKNDFFFLFSSMDLPQHTRVSFSFLLIFAALAVCQFVGFKQGAAYWLYWLGRGEYPYYFSILFSVTSHTSSEISIHPSMPPPTTHLSTDPSPTHPAIHPSNFLLNVYHEPWVTRNPTST